MRGGVLAAAVALLLCVCGTQAQLGATWIPTDLNYALISSLRGNSLQSPGDQLAGESPLLWSGSTLSARLPAEWAALCRLCNAGDHSC